MGIPQKLDLTKADVQIGGLVVTSAMSLEWNVDFKSADTIRDGKVISEADSEEQTKGKIELEQWEIGVLEKSLRVKGKTKGTLAGIKASIVVADPEGRSFNAPVVRFSKGAVKWDGKAADDKGSLDFEILGEFEADIHGGN